MTNLPVVNRWINRGQQFNLDVVIFFQHYPERITHDEERNSHIVRFFFWIEVVLVTIWVSFSSLTIGLTKVGWSEVELETTKRWRNLSWYDSNKFHEEYNRRSYDNSCQFTQECLFSQAI